MEAPYLYANGDEVPAYVIAPLIEQRISPRTIRTMLASTVPPQLEAEFDDYRRDYLLASGEWGGGY